MFTPIAIRVLSEDSVGKRKLKANKFYYFVSGFRIEDNDIYINPMRLEADKIYNDYFNDDKYPKIGISAIVGENGAGKSSLIEFYLRLINNFAACTIGETEVNSEGQHLHYIDKIQGEFYYIIDKTPYRLRVKNQLVTLEQYSQSEGNNNEKKGILYSHPKFIFNKNLNNLKELGALPINPNHSQLEGKNNIDFMSKHFFYTYVSNYSAYAYNTNDFANESNSIEYEEKIGDYKEWINSNSVEQSNWLGSIFWKNDGYQVPIVLSPFRSEGNIDINKENSLAKERLIALIIMPNSEFREINGHLEVKGFEIKAKNDEKYEKKCKNIDSDDKDFTELLQSHSYEELQNSIVEYWGKHIKEELSRFKSSRKYYSEAIGYLTYKTLKIFSTYPQYKELYKALRSSNKNESVSIDNDLDKLIKSLNSDKSHITKKIRQVLHYLVYGIYDIKDKKSFFDLSQTSNMIKELKNKSSFFVSTDDLIPPPIFDTTICLKEDVSGEDVKFETLSSGERQQAYVISSLLYHLSNINSVHNDGNNQRIAYKNVNVIMEEIELYYHPELQRTFLINLFKGISQINIPHIKNINICIVTHSPFILSDIPARNILALKKDEKDTSGVKLKTFGANIHEMLKDSFFLEKGSIGAYAEHVIREIIKELDKKDNEKYFIDEEKKLWNKIMQIDEPIIRTTLLNDYHHKFPSPTYKEMRIAELERRLKELKDN